MLPINVVTYASVIKSTLGVTPGAMWGAGIVPGMYTVNVLVVKGPTFMHSSVTPVPWGNVILKKLTRDKEPIFQYYGM